MLLLTKNEMESKSIEPWTKLVANASNAYREYFKFEEKYLTEHISRGGISLDIGCGDGRSLKTISKYASFAIGIDNDDEAVSIAKSNFDNSKNVLILNNDTINLVDYFNLNFDNIFCGLTFCNFGKSKHAILHQIYFKINPGNFIFSVYNENALDERLRMYNRAFEEQYQVDPKTGTIIFNHGQIISEQFTQRQLEEMLTEHDFKINDIQKGKIFYMVNCRRE